MDFSHFPIALGPILFSYTECLFVSSNWGWTVELKHINLKCIRTGKIIREKRIWSTQGGRHLLIGVRNFFFFSLFISKFNSFRFCSNRVKCLHAYFQFIHWKDKLLMKIHLIYHSASKHWVARRMFCFHISLKNKIEEYRVCSGMFAH